MFSGGKGIYLKSFFLEKWDRIRYSFPDFTQFITIFPTFFDDFSPMVSEFYLKKYLTKLAIFIAGHSKLSFTLLQNMQPSICKIYLANSKQPLTWIFEIVNFQNTKSIPERIYWMIVVTLTTTAEQF